MIKIAIAGVGNLACGLVQAIFFYSNKENLQKLRYPMIGNYKPEDIKNPSGLRIGVQEVTRWGMKEDDMKQIAEFIKMVVIDKRDPSEVREKVIEFRKNFLEVHYGFKITGDDEVKLLKIMLHAEY